MNAARYLTRASIAALLACGAFAPSSVFAQTSSDATPTTQTTQAQTAQPGEPAPHGFFRLGWPEATPGTLRIVAVDEPETPRVVPNDTIIIQRLQDGKLDPATMEKLQAILRQRQGTANEAFRIQTVPQTFWLGVECRAIDPAMRKPLKLEGDAGIVVGRVMDNGPAAKAGIVEGDLLLSYALLPTTDDVAATKSETAPKPEGVNVENELKSVEQLIDVVQQSGGRTLRLAVRREGEVKIIDVAPQPRVADAQPPHAARTTLSEQLQAREEAIKAEKRIAEWRKQMQAHGFAVPAAPLEAGTFDIVRAAPGFVLPQPLKVAKVKWPDDLSVSVERKGNEPAKITVRQGEKFLTADEKDLSKLPAHVRVFVEELLGRGPMTINLQPSMGGLTSNGNVRFSVTMPKPPETSNQPPVKQPDAKQPEGLHKIVIGKHEHGGFGGGQESELQALQQQLQAMQKQLDAIQKQTEAKDQPQEKVRKEKESAAEKTPGDTTRETKSAQESSED